MSARVGKGGGEGTGGFKLPASIPFNHGSHLNFVGTCLGAFWIVKYCAVLHDFFPVSPASHHLGNPASQPFHPASHTYPAPFSPGIPSSPLSNPSPLLFPPPPPQTHTCGWPWGVMGCNRTRDMLLDAKTSVIQLVIYDKLLINLWNNSSIITFCLLLCKLKNFKSSTYPSHDCEYQQTQG